MILAKHMLGEVAGMVESLFPGGCEVTLENLRKLRRNHIAVERDIGLVNFRGRSLVRFVTALAEADRMHNAARRIGCVQPTSTIDLVIRSFLDEAMVYDMAAKAYNDVMASLPEDPSPSDRDRVLSLASDAEWDVWDEDRTEKPK